MSPMSQQKTKITIAARRQAKKMSLTREKMFSIEDCLSWSISMAASQTRDQLELLKATVIITKARQSTAPIKSRFKPTLERLYRESLLYKKFQSSMKNLVTKATSMRSTKQTN